MDRNCDERDAFPAPDCATHCNHGLQLQYHCPFVPSHHHPLLRPTRPFFFHPCFPNCNNSSPASSIKPHNPSSSYPFSPCWATPRFCPPVIRFVCPNIHCQPCPCPRVLLPPTTALCPCTQVPGHREHNSYSPAPEKDSVGVSESKHSFDQPTGAEEEFDDSEEEFDDSEEEPVFVLTDEWMEFFAKSEAKRRQEKKLNQRMGRK